MIVERHEIDVTCDACGCETTYEIKGQGPVIVGDMRPPAEYGWVTHEGDHLCKACAGLSRHTGADYAQAKAHAKEFALGLRKRIAEEQEPSLLAEFAAFDSAVAAGMVRR